MRYEVELTEAQAREWDRSWPGNAEAIEYVRACFALADAIRANPPNQPRMDEPGWGEKVIAGASARSHREVWLHAHTTYAFPWQTSDGLVAGWADLIDPEPWTADA